MGKVKDFIGTIFYWIIFRILSDIERKLRKMADKNKELRTYEVIMASGERKMVVSTDEVIEQMAKVNQLKYAQFVHISTETDKSSLLHFNQVMEDN